MRKRKGQSRRNNQIKNMRLRTRDRKATEVCLRNTGMCTYEQQRWDYVAGVLSCCAQEGGHGADGSHPGACATVNKLC
jgi:hypothetical protein